MQACFSSMETGWLCNKNRVQRWEELASVSMVRAVESWGGGRGDWTTVLSFQLLPGDHGAGLWLARWGGGSAELREATVARFQAGHGAPESRDRPREQVREHTQHNSWRLYLCTTRTHDAKPCSQITQERDRFTLCDRCEYDEKEFYWGTN